MGSHFEASDVQAREVEIFGGAPRIPTPPRERLAAEVQEATQRLRGNILRNAEPLPVDRIPEIMFTMAPHREIWNAIMDLSIQIQGPSSRLGVRDRKLAILRTGWLCQAPYEFGEHVAQARRAGFTEEEIERITEGSGARGWSLHERAVLLAAEELHESAMISDETWSLLAAKLDERQLVELIVLVGQFTATAYLQNALRLRMEPGNRGLSSR